eukprot:tig00020961_g16681.t1
MSGEKYELSCGRNEDPQYFFCDKDGDTYMSQCCLAMHGKEVASQGACPGFRGEPIGWNGECDAERDHDEDDYDYVGEAESHQPVGRGLCVKAIGNGGMVYKTLDGKTVKEANDAGYKVAHLGPCYPDEEGRTVSDTVIKQQKEQTSITHLQDESGRPTTVATVFTEELQTAIDPDKAPMRCCSDGRYYLSGKTFQDYCIRNGFDELPYESCGSNWTTTSSKVSTQQGRFATHDDDGAQFDIDFVSSMHESGAFASAAADTAADADVFQAESEAAAYEDWEL